MKKFNLVWYDYGTACVSLVLAILTAIAFFYSFVAESQTARTALCWLTIALTVGSVTLYLLYKKDRSEREGSFQRRQREVDLEDGKIFENSHRPTLKGTISGKPVSVVILLEWSTLDEHSRSRIRNQFDAEAEIVLNRWFRTLDSIPSHDDVEDALRKVVKQITDDFDLVNCRLRVVNVEGAKRGRTIGIYMADDQ